MERIGEHAVVLGGSIAGLLAARVLADHYARVTVVDRDLLSADDGHRRGAPQSRQVHVLLPRGRQALEELLPGATEELVAHGAATGGTAEAIFCFSGQRLCPVDAGLTVIRASRLLLEQQVRSRVLDLPTVDLMQGWQVAGLRGDGMAVTGVDLRSVVEAGEARALNADLVVDATGRGSRAPTWLAALGFPRPPEEEVNAHVVYTTFEFPQRPAEPVHEIIVGPAAPRVRGGAAVAVEGGRWVVTLAGRGDEHAPTDLAGFVDYARTLPIPDIHELIRDREPLTEGVQYQYRANRRRRFELLDRFPSGLVVVGDALCSFNPIYAQGMSMAAVEALHLQRCLADGGARVGPRFFGAVADDLDLAWEMAVMADARYPDAGVPRTLRDRLIGSYLDRVTRVATTDPSVAAAFIRVVTMMAPPPSVLHPRIAGRVLADAVRGPSRGRAAPVPTAT